jgi:2-iminoacetate synthase
MSTATLDVNAWAKSRVKPEQVTRYLQPGGRDYVDDAAIAAAITGAKAPDGARLQALLDKSLAIQNLALGEVAELMQVSDPAQLERMAAAALKVKQTVYDKRIVTFAPLYLGNACVNTCRYCGFRSDNDQITRRVLDEAEIKAEVAVLAGRIGHKRLVAVYGEHPSTDADYIAKSVAAIYSVQVPVNGHLSGIRRVNVNAAPMSIEDLKTVHAAGLGTFQVFQETYQRDAYAAMHPVGPKSDFRWRLYAMHRAMEAGIEDVGLGVLYGLTDWRFEVLATILHANDLERQFGLGPHTVSFPRLEPAHNTPLASRPPHPVDDAEFLRIVMVMRLALPYVGLIVTAREGAEIRRQSFKLGITQTDASSSIGVGAYQDGGHAQASERQQFMLGDERPLEDVVTELVKAGSLTSFCTAGYRCGRTGKCIMDLLRSGQEGKFCKLNAALTFKEWIDDFGGPQVKPLGEALLKEEVAEIKERLPHMYKKFQEHYERTINGERDLYF